MDKQVASKIHDDAREKIAKKLAFYNCEPEWEKLDGFRRQVYLDQASQSLSLSGTTDIECPDCKGKGSWVEKDDACNAVGDPCEKCDGTGVIKHKWKIAVVLENGELPKLPKHCGWTTDALLEIAQLDMLNEKYRQVVG